MERRQSARIPFKAYAFTERNGKSVACRIHDISKNGMFITTQSPHNEGERTLVSIFLRDGDTALSVTLPCQVVRVSDAGIGCTSEHLDPETLLFMSNLIYAQKVAPTQFMQSFYNYTDWLELHAG